MSPTRSSLASVQTCPFPGSWTFQATLPLTGSLFRDGPFIGYPVNSWWCRGWLVGLFSREFMLQAAWTRDRKGKRYESETGTLSEHLLIRFFAFLPVHVQTPCVTAFYLHILAPIPGGKGARCCIPGGGKNWFCTLFDALKSCIFTRPLVSLHRVFHTDTYSWLIHPSWNGLIYFTNHNLR